jgi:hypothetical protein
LRLAWFLDGDERLAGGFVISRNDVQRILTAPTQDEIARVRGVVWICLDHSSGHERLTHVFGVDASLKHTLDRVDAKYQPLKCHAASWLTPGRKSTYLLDFIPGSDRP